MKIGVVTFWYGNDNYGMILQCWALQHYLKSLGHDAFIIKYNPIGSPLKRFVKNIISDIIYIVSPNQRHILKEQRKQLQVQYNHDKLRDFEGFRKNKLSFSEKVYYNMYSIRKKYPKADVYIAGSDQIWKSSLKYWSTQGFFLDFGPSDVRRVAYAPSFGMKEYPKEELGLLSIYLKKFDAISCREQDGVNICHEAGFKAARVLDPTFLLSSVDYSSIVAEKIYSDYIFIYSLNIADSSDIYYDSLKCCNICKNIIVTPASGYIPSCEVLGRDVTYKYAKPQEWLSLIKHANMVVTSSFHGIVFSIIFNKKFAFVPIKGPYSSSNNRVLDILHDLELEYAIVNCPEDYDRIAKTDFDWANVNKIKDGLINSSKLFINNAIS